MASKKISELDDGGALQPTDLLLVSRSGTSLRVSGSNVSSTPSSSGVVPGTYTNVTLTVDASGRITAASNGTAGGSGGIADAPSDGKAYARKDGAWAAAFSGAYGDLSDKPTIPSKVSDLTNDAGYLAAVPASGVSAGSYTNPTITLDATGRVTAAVNGAALTIPDQANHAGQFLTTDGNVLSWASAGSDEDAGSNAFKYWKVEVWNSTPGERWLGLTTLDLLQDGEEFHTATSVVGVDAVSQNPSFQAWFDRSIDTAGEVADVNPGHVTFVFTYSVAATIKRIRVREVGGWPREVPTDIVLSCSDDGVVWNQLEVFPGIPRGQPNGGSLYLNVTKALQHAPLPLTGGMDGKWLTVANGGPIWAPLPIMDGGSTTVLNSATKARYWRFSFDPSGGNNSAMGKIRMYTEEGGSTPIPLTILSYSTKLANDSGPEKCFDYVDEVAGWATANGDGRPYIDVDAGSSVQPTKFAFTSLNNSYYSLTMKSCQLFSSQDGLVYIPVQGFMMQELIGAPNITVEQGAAVASISSGGGMVPPPVSLFATVVGTVDGASPIIRYGRGVASIVRQGPGMYRVTFATPFSDLYYAVEGGCRHQQDGAGYVSSHLSINRASAPNSGKNLTYVDVILTYNGGNIYDPALIEFWMRAYDPRLHM